MMLTVEIYWKFGAYYANGGEIMVHIGMIGRGVGMLRYSLGWGQLFAKYDIIIMHI